MAFDLSMTKLAKLPTEESWSEVANLASLSLGVIKSNFLKSVMLPQRLATWLSAIFNIFLGIAPTNSFMLKKLKIPCL